MATIDSNLARELSILEDEKNSGALTLAEYNKAVGDLERDAREQAREHRHGGTDNKTQGEK